MTRRAAARTPDRDRSPGLLARAGNLAVRAVRVELLIYASIGRAIARRPALGPRDRGFRYHRPVLTVLIVLMAVSALEIPILDAIFHRWLPLRIFFLVLGIWGLTWMIGLFCAYLTRPHAVGPDGIRVREGLEIDLPVSWEDFASIRLHRTSVDPNDPDRTPGRVAEEDGEIVCAIRMSSDTNLELELERPTAIALPGLPPKGGEHRITRLRFWADDPEEFLAAVREELAKRRGEG